MIYTSYFGKLRKFPKNVFPVAICAKVPEWYTGARYAEFAPPYDLLMRWRYDHQDYDYAACFNYAILDCLDIRTVLYELHQLLPDEMRQQMVTNVGYSTDFHIALLCYEKPDHFCHRHLVAEWLRQNGVVCEELEI